MPTRLAILLPSNSLLDRHVRVFQNTLSKSDEGLIGIEANDGAAGTKSSSIAAKSPVPCIQQEGGFCASSCRSHANAL